MTSLMVETLPKEYSNTFNNTKFLDLKDLFNFVIDNQLISEVWYIMENELNTDNKALLEKSLKSSHLINI